MLRRSICLLTLVAFITYTAGCYTIRQVPVTDTEAIREAYLVTVVTKDGTVQKLKYVQVAEGYLVGSRPAGYGQPLETVTLDVDDIRRIEVKNINTGQAILAVGAEVGCAVLLCFTLLFIAMAMKQSCPFVYTHDGNEFVLEGELYSGAVLKAIERSDYLKLHHLAPRDGKCLLKISNEARETQYTDELSLLAVDHPQGTEVIADRDGKMCILSDPQPPVSAQDFEGRDVLDAVTSIDSLLWVANPLEKDPNESGDLKDGVVLRFERPDDGDMVQLAVHIGNTFWADYIFGRYMGLYGYFIDDWFESGQQDLSLATRAQDFMRENGLALNVQVLAGTEWTGLGYFYPTGPIALQDDVIEFEMPASGSDLLTIRLEGGSSLWMIDYAAVDHVKDPAIEAHELHPVEAFDEEGSDVAELLASADDHYYIMPKAGNHATIVYSAPPDKAGVNRTFIVRSEGYYTIHREKGQMPDFFALAGIKQGSEGFLQYSLKEFKRLWNSQQASRPSSHRSRHSTR